MRAWPFIFFLAACGFVTPEVGPTPYSYEVDCFTFAAELPLKQEILDGDVVRAHELVDKDVGDICDQPMKHIHVGREVIFKEGKPGYSAPGDGQMYLGRNLRSLVHELLHGIEWHRGIFNTGDHPDWGKKGFLELNLRFAPYVLDAAY